MSREFIKGTRRFSEGRRALSRAMEVPQIRRNPENSEYVPREGDVLINWGQTGERYNDTPTWINHPSNVQVACDKIATFNDLEEAGVPTVRYTMDRTRARRWMSQMGTVMHRALSRGSQGRGITLHTEYETLPRDGGFFCQIFGDENNAEYRVHVVGGEVIDTTQKRRRSRENGYTGHFDPTVRSAGNGWVYCRRDVSCPQVALEAAVAAVRAVGLDFGAVDLACSSDGRVCVYEINTAPGIEGTTIGRYATALRGLCDIRRGIAEHGSGGVSELESAVTRTASGASQ